MASAPEIQHHRRTIAPIRYTYRRPEVPLYLLLTSVSGRKLLSTVRTLILDEIHAVVGNRRGSHLALTMERLADLVQGPLQRIGLSATQKPLSEVAKFLVGNGSGSAAPSCSIIDAGVRRDLDVAIELPGSPLEAVMSNEVWTQVYSRLANLIQNHRTTLVFVNTRRLAERVTHHLSAIIGSDRVACHHGSLAARLRLDAENRLKHGELRALIATASLELGIDIGSVDLVCQIGPTRSINTMLQRVGRAEHRRGGKPKARLFPLSRDEYIECLATLHALLEGQLDAVEIPHKPLDVLAQQIVACASCEDWDEQRLFDLMRSAYPYRDLSWEEFQEVVRMLAEGFSTKRGRHGALIHYDGVNHRIRARRGARLVALTSGGAIPDNADYRVLVEPDETFIGTVNEDFAVESLAGDVFQLGSTSWKILRINSGTVRVADAHGQPPNIPFWLGEAPGRTAEVSCAVSNLLLEAEQQFGNRDALTPGGDRAQKLSSNNRRTDARDEPEPHRLVFDSQLHDYLLATYKALGALPSQETLIIERFFDESGGMQLVIHSPFGIRINRAWGLALRKRFCRSFNFELQAAATDDAIVLSLGTQHSFPLEEVFRYLNSRTVRDLLIQALLDSPMFPTRWRWNATRALALPRMRGGHKVAAPLQRMQAENLLAAVFPDQLACLENIEGDREIPDHPLVRQTIEDCLTEAMDINGLIHLLKRIENREIKCIARDLPEPSPMAHEILNARPYAFLDNAPLEERRTQAVYTRRALSQSGAASRDGSGLGILDPAAIQTVRAEAWPRATNPDELHDALLVACVLSSQEVSTIAPDAPNWLESLAQEKRAGRLAGSPSFCVTAERLPLIEAVYPDCAVHPPLVAPDSSRSCDWDRPSALREIIRGRLEISGPVTVPELGQLLKVPLTEVETALLALEAEGFALRGRFRPEIKETEWCDRRLLARIHRLTLNRLRAEIQPVTIAEFLRFLTAWQHVAPDQRVQGPEGLLKVIEALDGFEVAAGAWEPQILALRISEYSPEWLDRLCYTGKAGWGRLTASNDRVSRPSSPIRSSPISIFLREHLASWIALAESPSASGFSPDTAQVLELFATRGALFAGELLKQRSLLPSRIEQALSELAAQGWLTSDAFEGLRALLLPGDKRTPFANSSRPRSFKAVSSIEFAGRWSLLRPVLPASSGHNPEVAASRDGAAHESNFAAAVTRDEAVEAFARVLLRRYGVVFRRLLERESLHVSWYDLGRVYRRLEARGEIRGGYFVGGIGGEQFALPDAVAQLRSMRKNPCKGDLVAISGADPLNLAGILTPGRRVAAIAANRLLLKDGVPVAVQEGREVLSLEPEIKELQPDMERTLRIGKLPPLLRRYYA